MRQLLSILILIIVSVPAFAQKAEVTARGAQLTGTSNVGAVVVDDLTIRTKAIPQLTDFLGNWVNTNANTAGMTRVRMTRSGNDAYAHAFGRCSPTDCDLGRSLATQYSPGVSSTNVTALTAEYNRTAGISKFVVYKLRQRNLLEAQVFTRFTNRADSRSNTISTYTFRKQLVLPAPVQVSPRNNAVFSVFPRRTVLVWRSVQGAARYKVEVQYYDPGSNRWIEDYKTEEVSGLRWVFNFVGAQPGRWRVSAIDNGGVEGRRSGWRTFRYTR